MTRALLLALGLAGALGAPVTPPSAVDGAGNIHSTSLQPAVPDAGVTITGIDFPGYDPGLPTFLEVTAAGGSDQNNCLTWTAPCATVQGAINKIPKLVRHPYVVQVDAGVFSSGAYLSGFNFDVGNYTVSADAGPYIGVTCALSQFAGSGLMSGAVTSGTPGNAIGGAVNAGPDGGWPTVTVTGAGWTVNQLAGQLFCLASNGATHCLPIYYNTASLVELTGTFTGGAQPYGDAGFEIESPATWFDGGMAFPPGAGMGLGYGYAYTGNPGVGTGFGVTFWITGNVVPRFSSPAWQYATNDPPIAINDCGFLISGPETAAVSIGGGSNYAGVNNNFVQFLPNTNNNYSQGFVVKAGGVMKAVGNVINFADAGGGSGFFSTGDPWQYTAGTATMIVQNNVCTWGEGSGLPGGCVSVGGGAALVAQNAMLELGIGQLDWGTYVTGGSGTAVVSFGNEYNGLAVGILANNGSGQQQNIQPTSDEFDQNAIALEALVANALISPNYYYQGYAPSGVGNQIGWSIARGSKMYLGGISLAGLGDAGDIQVDQTYNYPYSYLMDGGSGAIWNFVTGTQVNQ